MQAKGASVSHEAMEVERWGEDQEVAMDVDLSVDEELHLLTEISHARCNLGPSLSSPSRLQTSISSTVASYTVRD